MILNLAWLLLGGIAVFLEYAWGGLVLCLTIVGIPFGLQAWKIGIAQLMPFGKKVERTGGFFILNAFLNIIWIIFAGLWIALTHLVLGIGLCLTIIGIPFGIQHFKLMRLSFAPFGYDLRDEY
jgi:uncharacterized membrane protein YccF (DUF307 family)